MQVSVWTAYYIGVLSILVPLLIVYILALTNEAFASNLFYWLGGRTT